jgi:PhnB protein
MARTSTYLNFMGTTEAAFTFYRAVFQTEFTGHIARIGDAPSPPGSPPLSDAEKQMVMHIELPITGGHMLMGTDALESMGQTASFGKGVHINLEPDTREETERLFSALSEGGEVTMALADMFWGAYYGSFTDKFGVHWMVNCSAK